MVEQGISRIKTYVEGLDKHMEGGIPENSVTLICGTAGTMKSSLAYSILYNNAVNEGLKGLYITLEQDEDSLMQQMKKLNMKEHKGVHLVDFSQVESFIDEQAQDDWILQISTYIKGLEREHEFDILVIDSLNALYSLTSVKDPRREIFLLFKQLKALGKTALLISEMSPDSPLYGEYGVEEFLADGIIHMDFQKRGDILSALERYIGIVKMRVTNHDTQYFPILYSGEGFRVFGREELELE
ncbi:MAG: AAA family ATPase [Euryarchaeota archaeon]|nr:AAA family ATPase [Euryarchaeota archaeon]